MEYAINLLKQEIEWINRGSEATLPDIKDKIKECEKAIAILSAKSDESKLIENLHKIASQYVTELAKQDIGSIDYIAYSAKIATILEIIGIIRQQKTEVKKRKFVYNSFIYVDRDGKLYKDGTSISVRFLDRFTVQAHSKEDADKEAWRIAKEMRPEYANYIHFW